MTNENQRILNVLRKDLKKNKTEDLYNTRIRARTSLIRDSL